MNNLDTLIKVASGELDIANLRQKDLQSPLLQEIYTDKEIKALSDEEKEDLAATDYRLWDEQNNIFSDSRISNIGNIAGLLAGLGVGGITYAETNKPALALASSLATGIGAGYLGQYLINKTMNIGRPNYKKYNDLSFPGYALVF